MHVVKERKNELPMHDKEKTNKELPMHVVKEKINKNYLCMLLKKK